MKKLFLILPLVFGVLFTGFTMPQDLVGEDAANQGDYNSGWNSGSGAGDGFGKWNLQMKTEGDNSHAGFYIASASDKADLNGVAIGGKAFGMYANGTSFEEAAAFRAFNRPLQVGQSFSLMMEHGQFIKKFDTDAAGLGGSCGFSLMPDVSGVSSPEDYNKNVRFEFGYYQNESAYMLYDADGPLKLDIPFTDAGMAITLTLVTADTYNLEVTVLATKHTYRFDKRKLGGTTGDPVGGFCLFDRNGETNDVYFNGFQILQKPQAQ